MRLRLLFPLLVATVWACGEDEPTTTKPRVRVPVATPTPTPAPPVVTQPPRADAGADRQARIGDQVVLDGSASSDPDSALAYAWRLVESPREGLAFAAEGAAATFVPQWNGRFVIELVVSDGASTSSDRVTVDVECQDPQLIDGWEDAHARWAERNPPPSCLDYLVSADVTVPAGQNLIIDPGVRIAVDANAHLGAMGGGFVAVGTEEAPIWIGGATGAWPGIEVRESPNTQLVHAVISGAGLSVQGASIALIEHSELRGSAGYGLSVGLFAIIENFYGNTLTDNALGAAEVEIGQVGKLAADSSFTGNGRDLVRARGTSMNTPSTWDAIGVPFVLGEPGEPTIRVQRDWYLMPGVVMQVEEGAGIEAVLPGITLTIAGTADKPVRIGSTSGMPGSWRGLAIGSGAQATIEHAIIEGGGGGSPWVSAQRMDQRANLAVLASSPRTVVDLSSTTLARSLGVGLWIEPATGVAVSCEDVTAEQAVMPACPYAL